MNERPVRLKPSGVPGKATAEDGSVLLDGPEGIAVTMTPDAATQTADSLRQAAEQARREWPDPPNDFPDAPPR